MIAELCGLGLLGIAGALALSPLCSERKPAYRCKTCGDITGPLQTGVCDECLPYVPNVASQQLGPANKHGIHRSSLECPNCHHGLLRSVQGKTVQLWCDECCSEACLEGSFGMSDIAAIRRIAAELDAERERKADLTLH